MSQDFGCTLYTFTGKRAQISVVHGKQAIFLLYIVSVHWQMSRDFCCTLSTFTGKRAKISVVHCLRSLVNEPRFLSVLHEIHMYTSTPESGHSYPCNTAEGRLQFAPEPTKHRSLTLLPIDGLAWPRHALTRYQKRGKFLCSAGELKRFSWERPNLACHSNGGPRKWGNCFGVRTAGLYRK